MDATRLVARYGLAGRRAVVAGASDGLGLACARELAALGAAVTALSRSGVARDGVAETGIVHRRCDVADPDAVRAAIAAAGADGVDILVLAAGATRRCRAEAVEDGEWRRLLAIDLDAAFWLCRAAHPYLKASPLPGRIIAITSMAAHLGFAEVVPYVAAKAGLSGLVRGLAVEWAGDGILVNAVAPGWFPSALTAGVMDAERRARILARMPLHRFGEHRELAAAVAFLASPAASYITGAELPVDGGALAYGY